MAHPADASNFGEHAYAGRVRGDEVTGHRIDALARHCQAFGRPRELVLRTHTTYPLVLATSATDVAEKIERYVPRWVRDLSHDTIVAGVPATIIAHYERLIASGLQYFIAFVYGNDVETVRLLADEVIPEIRHRTAAASGATS